MNIQVDDKQAARLAKTFPYIFSGETLELDLKAIENLGKIVKIGHEMRAAQSLFDRTRSDKALATKKRLESEFDALLEKLKSITTPPETGTNTLFQ